MQGTKTIKIPSRMFLRIKIFDWDLDSKNGACSYRWQRSISNKTEKIFFIMFFWIILDKQDFELQWSRSTVCHPKNHSQASRIRLSFCWRSSNCSGWVIYIWILSRVTKSCIFWTFRSVTTMMQRTQIKNHFFEKISTTRRCLMATLMEEKRLFF